MNIPRALWWTWALMLAASLLQERLTRPWWEEARLDLRTGSCLVLVAAASWNWWALLGRPAARAAGWFALGMALGFYGDSHVAAWLWWPPVREPLVGGIVFFGFGHLAYVVGSIALARRLPADGRRWSTPILAWQMVALAAWAAIALSSTRQQALRGPTLGYTLLVAATPGATTVLWQRSRAFAALALGAALFLASDMLLAYQAFHGAFPGLDELIWLCYGPGQMLIIYGSRWGIDHEPRLSPDDHG